MPTTLRAPKRHGTSVNATSGCQKKPHQIDGSFTIRVMNSGTEEERQAALDALGLDLFERTAFNDLVKLAADTFEVPIATISIVDRDRQWFMSPVGLDVAERRARLRSVTTRSVPLTSCWWWRMRRRTNVLQATRWSPASRGFVSMRPLH